MASVQLLSLVFLAVCFLAADYGQCKKQRKSKSLTTTKEIFSVNEKRIPPALPLFVGLSSLSMGITNRIYGNLGSIETAKLKQGLRDIKIELSTLIEELKNHVTFIEKNGKLNNIIEACVRFDALREAIEAEQTESGGNEITQNMKNKAKRILTGKRNDGAELDSLRDGVKQVLREFDSVFYGPELGFPKESIILLFAKSLNPRRVDFLRNTLHYLAEAVIAQEMCLKAMKKASEIERNMTEYVFTEDELMRKKDEQQQAIEDMFTNPIMGPYSWHQVSQHTLPSASNVVKGSSNKMLCQVNKGGESYTGILDHNNLCMYMNKHKSSKSAENFAVLYNRCVDYPLTFSGSSGLDILSDAGKKICRYKPKIVNDMDPKVQKHWESFGTVSGNSCTYVVEYLGVKLTMTSLGYMNVWKKRSYTIKYPANIVKTHCNINEMYKNIFSKYVTS